MSGHKIAGDVPQITASQLVELAWQCAERGAFIGAAQNFEDAAKVMRQLHAARMP